MIISTMDRGKSFVCVECSSRIKMVKSSFVYINKQPHKYAAQCRLVCMVHVVELLEVYCAFKDSPFDVITV